MPGSDVRLFLYGILTAGLPLLVFYGLITKDSLPLWIALGGAVLAPGGAAAALMVQRRAGLVEPKRTARKPKASAPREAP